MRVAIGASRMALIRQFAAESLVLAAAGAVVALFLARGLGHILLYALTTQGGAPALISHGLARSGLCDRCRVGYLHHLRHCAGDSSGSHRSGRGHEIRRQGIDRRARAPSGPAPDGRDPSRDGPRHARRGAAVRRELQEPSHCGHGHAPRRHCCGNTRFPESIVRERFDDFRREMLAEIKSVPGIVDAGTTSIRRCWEAAGATAFVSARSRTALSSRG